MKQVSGWLRYRLVRTLPWRITLALDGDDEGDDLGTATVCLRDRPLPRGKSLGGDGEGDPPR